MRVAIDNQIFLNQKFGGISRSFCSLNEKLNTLPFIDSKIIAPIHINKHLLSSGKKLSNNLYFPYKFRISKLPTFFDSVSNQLARIEIGKFKPNLIHETFYNVDDPWPATIARVTTIQDLIREKIEISKERMRAKDISLRRAQRIICISQNTKIDLIETFRIDPAIIDVVYLGVDSEFFAREINFTKSNNLLYVGQRNGYKNFNSFITAYANSKFLRENFQVVAFGGGKFSKNELRFFLDLKISRSQLINIQGSDIKLFELYSNTAALIYPSKYEGFGLPIVEAMAAGAMVFCSDTSSMPEAGGKTAFYFDPNSIESIMEVLESKLSANLDLRKILQDGQNHARHFDWSVAAIETLKTYKKVFADV